MSLVFSAASSFHIRARDIGPAISCKLPVNVELYLYMTLRLGLIDYPPGNISRVGGVECAAKKRRERRQVETDGDRTDE
jgi:hypothetical protein